MTDDEIAIRRVVERWQECSAAGDIDRVLEFMADDVVFLVAGQQPFGKREFARAFRDMAARGMTMTSSSDVLEVLVAGDWAWCRAELHVAIASAGKAPVRRGGQTLTVFRRVDGERWVIARDANLLALE